MCPLATRTKRIFLISNYNEFDRKKISNMIYTLGGFITDLNDDFIATHLVVPYFKTTPKMVAALAAGIWIVQTSYVLRSYRTGHWEHEAAYEIGSPSCPYYVLSEKVPFIDASDDAPRICREKALVRNKPNLSSWKVGLIMDDPEELLHAKRLLKAGGATVSTYKLPLDIHEIDKHNINFMLVSVEDTTLIKSVREHIPCVPYDYVAECLCKDPPPDISDYDFQRCQRKDKFISKDIDKHEDSCKSSPKKEFKCEDDSNESKFSTVLRNGISSSKDMVNINGKSKIKITVNTPMKCPENLCNSDFYFNVNVSASVAFKKQNRYIVDLGGAENIEDKKCFQDTCVKNELTMPKISDTNLCGENMNSIVIKQEIYPSSAGRKRLPSPRYISPSKRKKTFYKQSNTIINYVIRGVPAINRDNLNLKNIEHASVANASSSLTYLPVTNVNKSCVDTSVGVDCGTKGFKGWCTNQPPDFITLSSDEETETCSNSASLLTENVKQVLSTNNMDTSRVRSQVNEINEFCQTSPSSSSVINICDDNNKKSVKKAICKPVSSIVVTVSSSDDECSSDFQKYDIIDLTCDDDIGGDVFICDNEYHDNKKLGVQENKVWDSSSSCHKPQVSSSTARSEDYKSSESECLTKIEPPVCISESLVSSSCKLSKDSEKFDKKNIKPFVYSDGEENNTLRISELSLSENGNKTDSRDIFCQDVDSSSDIELPFPPTIPHIESHNNTGYSVSTTERSMPSIPLRNIESELILVDSNLDDNSTSTHITIHDCESDESNLSCSSLENSLAIETKPESADVSVTESIINQQFDSYSMIIDDENTSKSLDGIHCLSQQKYLSSSHSNHVRSEVKNSKSVQLENFETHQIETECSSKMRSSKILPSAEEVCNVQAGVYCSKLNRPWIEMGAFYIPQCIVGGPTECYLSHGEKVVSLELEHYDENFLREAVCPSSAIELLQRRIDLGMYPSSTLVQHALYCVMEQWNEIGIDALLSLNHLLKMHPPCASGMLDYYKKIFFSPIHNMASDGIFWYCLTKIEEILNFKTEKSVSPMHSPNISPVREEILENVIFPPINHTNRGTWSNVRAVKLQQLFNCLDYFNDVMEGDLEVGLLRNINNLQRYISRNTRPLVAVALWGNQSVGPVNSKCKQVIKIYLNCREHGFDKMYRLSLNRLVNMMAAVVYASERNAQPPKYPNIGLNCKNLACHFSSNLMESDLNMFEVTLLLNSLKPDWFKLSVSCSLLEKLYGRNMDMKLQPVIALLKNLWSAKQKFPSKEEATDLLLCENDSSCVKDDNSLEASQNLVKSVTKRDKKGETRLHIACRLNRFSEVEKILSIPHIKVNEEDNAGWTPLHEASLHGSVECVKLLLNHRTPSGGPAVDPHVKNHNGVTPLMDAVLWDHLEVASLLLDYGGKELLKDTNEEGKSAQDFVHTDEMENILARAPDHSKFYILSTVPTTLCSKLTMLVPRVILYYLKFSEVRKITFNLTKCDLEMMNYGTNCCKFRPVAFKEDYKDLKSLQGIVKEMLISNFGLADKLIFLL